MNLKGITRAEYHKNGVLKECTLSEQNIIETTVGSFIAKHKEEEARQKNIPSVSFYESGRLRRLALDMPTRLDTPIGSFPAELITFYESGALKRVFPLNGKISGYWTEEDEEQLCETFQFHLSVGAFKAKIISFHLYENGNLKSLTLWPNQDIVLRTNAGLLPVRSGFALYENGNIKSVEPAYPIKVATLIGDIVAYDNMAVEINADENSLCFDENGDILALKTYSSFSVFPSGESHFILKPLLKAHPLEDERKIKVPLSLCFATDKVRIECAGSNWEYDLVSTKIVVLNEMFDPKEGSCSSDCSDCTGCRS